MSMGDIIRRLRLEKGMTQEELGNVIGVQKSAIRKYESGRVENIPRSSIHKMAKLFGVKPSYLMGFAEEGGEEETAPTPMTEAEAALLELFKRVPADKQNLVLGMIRAAIENQG